MAKLKREAARCPKKKGNCKATAIFGTDEKNGQPWQKHKTAISECKVP
jgi:hypothetical protein